MSEDKNQQLPEGIPVATLVKDFPPSTVYPAFAPTLDTNAAQATPTPVTPTPATPTPAAPTIPPATPAPVATATPYSRPPKQQQQQQSGPSAWLRVAKGSQAFSMLGKLGTESKGLLGQSSQQVMSAIKKGTDKEQWNGVSDKVTTAFTQSQGKVTFALAQSQTKLKSAYISLRSVGESVQTNYGMGKVVAYDEATSMYKIQISFGTLYTKSMQAQKKKAATALELNSAYELWEKARRTEVECECKNLGIPFTENTMHQCFTCLKTPKSKSKPMLADAEGNPLFPSLYSFRTSSEVMMTRNTDKPCLLCGAVVCSQHSSEAFRKEGISVCLSCVEHLEFDFGSAKLPQELENHTQHLVELYGRAQLLLQYCSQFMLPTADSLEQNTKQHNQIGVGGSSAGLVSGILGVAAACSILTPAGPPLLIASLVFGGSATAVQTGSEAYKYYSEPSQFANRIITLHGIMELILATVKLMRDSTLLPYLDQAVLRESRSVVQPTNQQPGVPVKVTAVKAGTRIGSMASTSASLVAQEGALAGRFVSRATTAAARTARFARFAGGALSAATIALEANEMRKTVEQIQQGSPCDKAKILREIHANIRSLPAASYVERLSQSYVKVRAKELFQQAIVTVSSGPELALQETCENPDIPSEITTGGPRSEEDWSLVEEVLSSLEAEVASTQTRKLRSKTSLLERVQRYKEREL